MLGRTSPPPLSPTWSTRPTPIGTPPKNWLGEPSPMNARNRTIAISRSISPLIGIADVPRETIFQIYSGQRRRGANDGNTQQKTQADIQGPLHFQVSFGEIEDSRAENERRRRRKRRTVRWTRMPSMSLGRVLYLSSSPFFSSSSSRPCFEPLAVPPLGGPRTALPLHGRTPQGGGNGDTEYPRPRGVRNVCQSWPRAVIQRGNCGD